MRWGDVTDSRGEVTKALAFERGAPADGGIFDPAIFDGGGCGHVVVGEVTIDGDKAAAIRIPPVAERPLVAIEDPAARTRWLGPKNLAWLALVEAAQRARRLIEINAPAPMRRHEAARVQYKLDAAIACHEGRTPPADPFAGEPSSSPLALLRPCPPAESEEIRALLWLDDQKILVQSTTRCRVLDRAGTLLRSFESTGALATQVCGNLVVFGGGQRGAWPLYTDSPWPDDAEATALLAAYDLAAESWLGHVDERMPRQVADESDVSGVDMHDLRARRSEHLAPFASEPALRAQTRDGRFAWVAFRGEPGGSAVIEISTCRPFVEPISSPDALEECAFGGSPSVPAVSYHTSSGWRLVDQTGAVGDGERWWARLRDAGPVAFSPDGTELAAIHGERLVILDASAPCSTTKRVR